MSQELKFSFGKPAPRTFSFGAPPDKEPAPSPLARVYVRAYLRGLRCRIARIKELGEPVAEEMSTLAKQQRNALISMLQTRHAELLVVSAAAEQARSDLVRMEAQAAAEIARIQNEVAQQVKTAEEAEQLCHWLRDR